MHVNLTVWGNAYWDLLHLIAYTSEDPDLCWEKINEVVGVLPCGICTTHARAYMSNNKEPPMDWRAVNEYLLDFHNDVNRRSGKPIFDWYAYVERYSSLGKEEVARQFKLVTEHLGGVLVSEYANKLLAVSDSVRPLLGDYTAAIAVKKPEPKKLEPKKLEPKKLEPKKLEPKKSEPKKLEPKKPEPKDLEPKEPTARQPVARQSMARQSMARHAVARQPVARQTVARQSMAMHPVARRPTRVRYAPAYYRRSRIYPRQAGRTLNLGRV